MLITREGEVGGLPAVQARDLMKTIREYAVSLGELALLLDTSAEEARRIVQRLEEHGYVCRVEPFTRCNILFTSDEVPPGTNADDLEYWGTTVTGNALSKARIGRPMSREKAAQLLDGLIVRAAAVNADHDSLFTVERIELFGSFADPGRREVGDVDVRLLFDRRVDGDEFIRQGLAAADEAEENGRRFNSHVERLGFVEREFQRFLRGRSPRLDIQFDAVGHESPLPDGVVTQVVYSRRPEMEHHVPASTG